MTAPTGNPISSWETRFDDRQQEALAAAHALGFAILESTSVELLVDGLLNDHAAAEVEPLYDQFRIDTREAATPRDAPAPSSAKALQLSLTLPCRGGAALLMSTPPRAVHSTMGMGDRYEVMITLEPNVAETTDQDAFTGWVAEAKAGWLAQLAEAVSAANVTIREHRSAVRAVVEPVIRRRRQARLLISQAAQTLDIPLDSNPTPGASIPLRPRTVNLATIEASAAAGGNEAGLALDIADALVDLIASFGTALERLPVTANKLADADEEAIRDVLLFILNANWRGTATGETFLGEGKTDILLRWRDRDAFIGECKFWKGEKAFTDGLDQLLGRYTVWRATRVALLLFIRDRVDISATIEKAESAIGQHPRFIGVADSTASSHAAFLMKAQHDSQKVVTLTLLPIVIPQEAQ